MPTGAAEGDGYHTYYLAALVYARAMFMAYTGLRRAETEGLELRDVTLSTASDGTIKGSARVQRTKTRVRREWVTGTPKSNHSRRTVPLPPWLAAKMADYLRDTHPASHDSQRRCGRDGYRAAHGTRAGDSAVRLGRAVRLASATSEGGTTGPGGCGVARNAPA